MCGVSTLEYFKEFFKAAIKRVQSYACISYAEREQFRFVPRQRLSEYSSEFIRELSSVSWLN